MRAVIFMCSDVMVDGHLTGFGWVYLIVTFVLSFGVLLGFMVAKVFWWVCVYKYVATWGVLTLNDPEDVF